MKTANQGTIMIQQRYNKNEKMKGKASYVCRFLPYVTGKLSFTLDCWTSSNSFYWNNCHFIDKSWNLNEIVIGFKLLEGPHTVFKILLMHLNKPVQSVRSIF